MSNSFRSACTHCVTKKPEHFGAIALTIITVETQQCIQCVLLRSHVTLYNIKKILLVEQQCIFVRFLRAYS